MGRTADRVDFDPPIRIRLLERDMDQSEEAVDRLTAALEIARRELNEQIDGIRKILISMAISMATAAVLFALNLLAGG